MSTFLFAMLCFAVVVTFAFTVRLYYKVEDLKNEIESIKANIRRSV